jgi:hypothetical protein
MTIEDIIRRIIREEIARCVPMMIAAPTKAGSNIDPGFLRPVPRWDPPSVTPKRMGCTCPPGAQTSCPDVACPWKPK